MPDPRTTIARIIRGAAWESPTLLRTEEKASELAERITQAVGLAACPGCSAEDGDHWTACPLAPGNACA